MAAALAVAKGSSSRMRRPSNQSDSSEGTMSRFKAQDRESDMIVRDEILLVLLNGAWKKRRIVCTKENLFFALVEDDLIRDRIPLKDVLSIDMMREPKDFEDMVLKYKEPRVNIKNAHEARKSSLKTASPDEDSALVKVLQIRTLPDGFNSGRTYYLQAESKEVCELICNDLRELVSTVKKMHDETYGINRFRGVATMIHRSIAFKVFSSLLILLNFAMSVAQAQLQDNTRPSSTFLSFASCLDALEIFITLAFTVELLINACANLPFPFLTSPWSLFDLVVVVISLISLAPLGLPSRIILLVRTARVLRIFGKVRAVSKILSALQYSIVPMANAFFIIFIVSAIYATIGATFFNDDSPEYFYSFSQAFSSMFRITVGAVDWWFDQFPLVQEDGSVSFGSTFFFISYVVLVQWVFLQVSIAVLLDNFLTASNAMKKEKEAKHIQERQLAKQFINPLDPLLLRLAKDYIDDEDLAARLAELFKLLDADGSGDLSSQEFQEAMKKLDFTPRIFVSDSDFVAMTRDGALCNSNGRIGMEQFEKIMREQLRLYTQGRLSATSEFWRVPDADFTEFGALKQILIEQLGMRTEQESLRSAIVAIADRLGVSNGCTGPTSSCFCKESFQPFAPAIMKGGDSAVSIAQNMASSTTRSASPSLFSPTGTGIGNNLLLAHDASSRDGRCTSGRVTPQNDLPSPNSCNRGASRARRSCSLSRCSQDGITPRSRQSMAKVQMRAAVGSIRIAKEARLPPQGSLLIGGNKWFGEGSGGGSGGGLSMGGTGRLIRSRPHLSLTSGDGSCDDSRSSTPTQQQIHFSPKAWLYGRSRSRPLVGGGIGSSGASGGISAENVSASAKFSARENAGGVGTGTSSRRGSRGSASSMASAGFIADKAVVKESTSGRLPAIHSDSTSALAAAATAVASSAAEVVLVANLVPTQLDTLSTSPTAASSPQEPFTSKATQRLRPQPPSLAVLGFSGKVRRLLDPPDGATGAVLAAGDDIVPVASVQVGVQQTSSTTTVPA